MNVCMYVCMYLGVFAGTFQLKGEGVKSKWDQPSFKDEGEGYCTFLFSS